MSEIWYLGEDVAERLRYTAPDEALPFYTSGGDDAGKSLHCGEQILQS